MEKEPQKEPQNVVNAKVAPPLSGQGTTPQIVIQNHVGSPLTRWVSWLGWLGFMLCIPVILGMTALYSDYFDTTEGLTESYHSLSTTAGKKIALIRAEGTIMTSEGFVAKQIARVRKDKSVKAVVLRVNSPGGTVTASDNLYYQLKKLREERDIPMVVSMGGMAASGGYYIAMAVGDQEDVIYAEPTTTTGSIGVIIPHYNVSKLMEKYEVVNDSIVSHPRKQLLSATKETSEEDREILQNYVNESFDRFKEIVKSGRPQFQDDPAALDILATGEIFTGAQAQRSGLVDKIGYLEDAIARAAELAGFETDSVRVVEYAGPASVLDLIGAARMSSLDDSAALGGQVEQHLVDNLIQNLAVPRAYYMFTSCAALAGSAR